MTIWTVLIAAAACSAAFTGWLRRYALAHRLLDIPNARSSHREPTPRGGGIAIASTFLAGIIVLALLGAIDLRLSIALAGSGFIVAVIGHLDDLHNVPPIPRLLAHFAGATWALGWLGGLGPFLVLGMSVDAGLAGSAIAVLALVWLLNLYNFMDGIDGIAGIEAVTVAFGAAALGYFIIGTPYWFLPALIGVAAAGFLVWNWPPAKIFMGDVGSGFLGLTMGVMAVQAAAAAPPLLWSWIVLLGVFVIDATITLLRRFLRGEPAHQAHRSHAYQHAARRFGGHRPISLTVGIINVVWLLPIAAVIAAGWLDGLCGVMIAYAPLIATALWLGAGLPEEPVANAT